MLQFIAVLDRPLTAAEAARAVRLRLTYDERSRSRLAAMTVDGRAAAVQLPRGVVLRDGAALVGPDGELAHVEAAPQRLARVTAPDALALLRAVYHLANRHVAAQLAPDHALIEPDPVLEAMLRSLGATVVYVDAPFDPEGGAYGGHGHGHAHGHGHEADAAAASLGEQLSIAAHARRASPRA